MASHSASSRTLSLESIDREVPMDIDDDNSDHAMLDDERDEFSEEDDFVLPEEYGEVGGEWELSPPMKAASNPDPNLLRAVLSHGNSMYVRHSLADIESRREEVIPLFPGAVVGDFSFPMANMAKEFGPHSVRITGGEVGITAPLMEAIRAQLPENIRILLEAGADPNGIPIEVMSRYAAFFLRFRPSIPRFVDDGGDVASRELLLECMDLPQMSGLTLEEVEDRFWDGMAPFWCEEGFIKANFYPHGESAPSLVEAARCGSIEIFNQIWAAGADASFWMAPQFKLPSQDDHNFIQEQDDIRPHFVVPEPPTPSSLSISTPVHAALQNRDVEMLKHLLAVGFDPNTMPLANPTRCFTPLMGTIIHHSTFSRSEFDILVSHPSININLRTPIYGVHILHFAVAALDLDMLKYVAVHTPLKNAGVTALGNTLLHIACMPSDALAVQRHAEIIYDSIHETRDLHASNDPYASCPPDLNFYPVVDEKELQRQTAVVKYLWENGITDVEKRDVHGNTALHYLAGCRDFNDELMNWWIEQQGVERVWRESSNEYGASPEELYYAGQIAKRDGVRGYMPWFDRSRWTDARKRRKEEIWKGLLREKKRQILETGSMHE